jgi:pyridoxine 4-dehydrogenase
MSITQDRTNPAAARAFAIGGDMPVSRIGLGTMRLTGPGTWYHGDEKAAKKLLRRAFELGVNHFDTADAYGPESVEHYLRKALHRYADGYPEGVVIATKGGYTRQGPDLWAPCGRPEYLMQCIAMSLRRLALERIDLYYLHRIDPAVAFEDQVGVLAEAKTAGLIRHIGLCRVNVDQLKRAEEITPIAAVQNRYNHTEGDNEVLNYCTTNQIAFIPFAPFAAGQLFDGLEPERTAPAAQQALTHLLQLAPCVLPIPGTASLTHLETNCRASETARHRS